MHARRKCIWAFASLILSSAGLSAQSSSISSKFNGDPVAAGEHVWFNSVFTPGAAFSNGTIVRFVSSTIQFSLSGVTTFIAVPDATVHFSNATTTPYTSYSIADGWVTYVPSGYRGNIFLDGFSYLSPGIPGGNTPVSWSGSFETNSTTPLNLQWKWAAAAYGSAFADDMGTLGVKSVDIAYGPPGGAFNNLDRAGSPEFYAQYLSARSNGATNYTGSYSAAAALVVPAYNGLASESTAVVPEPAAIALIAVGLCGVGLIARRRRNH